jgi:hypothetical protein
MGQQDDYTPEQHKHVDNIVLNGVAESLKKGMLAKHGARKLAQLEKDPKAMRKALGEYMKGVLIANAAKTRAAYNAPSTDNHANTLALGRHDELISEWLGKGLTREKIGKKFGVSGQAISQHIKGRGIVAKLPKQAKAGPSSAEWAALPKDAQSAILTNLERSTNRYFKYLNAKYTNFVDKDELHAQLSFAMTRALPKLKGLEPTTKPTTYLYTVFKNAAFEYERIVLKAIEEHKILEAAQSGFTSNEDTWD